MHEEFTQKTPISRLILVIVSTVVLFTLGIYIGFDLGQKDTTSSTEEETTITANESTTTETVSTDETVDWNTYTDEINDFTFKYPATWVTFTRAEYPNTVYLQSPETKTNAENTNKSDDSETNIPDYDMGIKYGNSLKQVTTFDSSSINNLESVSKSFYKELGTTKLGGNYAIEFQVAGTQLTYSILTEKNNVIFELFVMTKNKSEITNTEQKIIDSFEFAK